MMDLYNGVREPADEAEKVFVEQIKSEEVITDQKTKIFKKYLNVIKPRHLHRLCSVGNDEELSAQGYATSGDESNLD